MLYQSNTLSVEHLATGFARMHFDKRDGSVNLFDRPTINDLSEALTVLEQTPGIRGLLVTSGKKVFVAGADVAFLERSRAGGSEAVTSFISSNNVNFNRLEDLPFPVVTAINGAALGGGFELCLAADARVMSTNAVIGLPETTLGIFPGWGGTVRLPRVIGLALAAEWIAAGKTHRASGALESGAVDALASPEELETQAQELLEHCVGGQLDYRARRAAKTSPLTDSAHQVTTDLAGLKATLRDGNVPSAFLAVESMEQSALLARDQALAVELAAVTEAVATDAAGAMLGNFVSDQKLSHLARSWGKRTNRAVTSAAVLGAGIMGGGIAYASALKGVDTRMKDIVQEGLDAGMEEAESLLSRRVRRGQMNEEKKAEILGRIHPTLKYDDGFDQVNMVVEAVVENPTIKHAVLTEVEDRVSPDTVIASNTSTISITHLAEPLQRPENFCGMHFFNPVHAMPLVEVIRGGKTSEEAVARTVAYAVTMGKKPVVVNDCPGFLVNRALFPYFFGFSMLLRDGADFQQVDQVMEQWGWPMGPAYLADVIGIDTLDHCESVMADGYPDRMSMSSPLSIEILASAELYGRKNGTGFYNYSKDENGHPVKLASDRAYELLKPHCAGTGDFSDKDIVARMMIPMAMEMARILDDGIVENAYEADLGLLYGLGFPAFRGGVLRWMDSVGLDRICDMADACTDLGTLYEPTDSIRQLAAQKVGFYSAS